MCRFKRSPRQVLDPESLGQDDAGCGLRSERSRGHAGAVAIERGDLNRCVPGGSRAGSALPNVTDWCGVHVSQRRFLSRWAISDAREGGRSLQPLPRAESLLERKEQCGQLCVESHVRGHELNARLNACGRALPGRTPSSFAFRGCRPRRPRDGQAVRQQPVNFISESAVLRLDAARDVEIEGAKSRCPIRIEVQSGTVL
jgi:hypothetical protein